MLPSKEVWCNVHQGNISTTPIYSKELILRYHKRLRRDVQYFTGATVLEYHCSICTKSAGKPVVIWRARVPNTETFTGHRLTDGSERRLAPVEELPKLRENGDWKDAVPSWLSDINPQQSRSTAPRKEW